MINKGDSLEGPAMRSSGAATGTRRAMPACSISTTTGPTTRTTMSASADPKISRFDHGHAHVKPIILGRESPGSVPKARHYAKPTTAAGPHGAAAECGSPLFQQLTSITNLYECWLKAKQNKSQSLRVQRFNEDPWRYLVMIQDRLRAGAYTFGPYKTFTVREKKHRHVVDAPMKDRIVHWMLYQYLLPLWTKRFIHDTYGNLTGRGTHAAVKRLAQFARGQHATWSLTLDISKYFFAVNHDALKRRALRYVGDTHIRQLLTNLIDSYSTDDRYDDLFPADGMYRNTTAKGMPIGNLSSQLFANIYLSEFDHWVKQDLCIRQYIRYVDDMVILGDSPAALRGIASQIAARLANDGLTIHPKKIRLAPTAAGIPFLGYVVWPNHISAGSYVRGRFLYRVRQHEAGGLDRSEAIASYRSIFMHTGSTVKNRSTP